MEPRTMPIVTFKCKICTEQKSLIVNRYTRHVDELDTCRPHPEHHNRQMDIIQVDFMGKV